MPVGDVNIGKTVIVEIKRAATPRPAAARNAVAQSALVKTSGVLTEVEAVSVHELDGHGRGVGNTRSGQSQVRQPIHRGRMHADDQEINEPVRIKVGDRVRHAGGVWLVEPPSGDVREMAASVILVQVRSAEI